MAAGYLLRENVEDFGERLKPGEMGLALELNHQLQRAEGMINALGAQLQAWAGDQAIQTVAIR